MTIPAITKTCMGCGLEKDIDAFGKDSQKKDGLRTYCKDCQNAKSREAYQRLTEEKIASIKKTRKKWAIENRDKASLYTQKYVALNKERVSEYNKRYATTNRHKCLALNAARRAAIDRATPPWADRQQIIEIYELAQEFRDAGFDIDVDHIVPINGRRVSGLHTQHNLRPCLTSVNRSKSNKFHPS